eukprot:jgi/Psemu1/284514/fgenesh1_pg.56_\
MEDKSSSRSRRQRSQLDNNDRVGGNSKHSRSNHSHSRSNHDGDDERSFLSRAAIPAKGAAANRRGRRPLLLAGPPNPQPSKEAAIPIPNDSSQRSTSSRFWRQLELVVDRNVGKRLVGLGNHPLAMQRHSSGLEGALDVIEHLARNISGVGYLSDLGLQDGESESTDGSIETNSISSSNSSYSRGSFASSSKGAASWRKQKETQAQAQAQTQTQVVCIAAGTVLRARGSSEDPTTVEAVTKQRALIDDDDEEEEDDDDDEEEEEDDDDDQSLAKKKQSSLSLGQKARKMIQRSKPKSSDAADGDGDGDGDNPTTASKPKSPDGALRRRKLKQQLIQERCDKQETESRGTLQSSQDKGPSIDQGVVYSDNNPSFASFETTLETSPDRQHAKASTLPTGALQTNGSNLHTLLSVIVNQTHGPFALAAPPVPSSTSDVSNGTKYDNREVVYDDAKRVLRLPGLVEGFQTPIAIDGPSATGNSSCSNNNNNDITSFRSTRSKLFDTAGKQRSAMRMTAAGLAWDTRRSSHDRRPRRTPSVATNSNANANANPSTSNHTSSSRDSTSIRSEVLRSDHHDSETEDQEVVVCRYHPTPLSDNSNSRSSLQNRLGNRVSGTRGRGKQTKPESETKDSCSEAKAVESREKPKHNQDGVVAPDPISESFDSQYDIMVQEVNASNYNSFLEEFARENKNSTYVPDSDDDSSCASKSPADLDGDGDGDATKCCLSYPRPKRGLAASRNKDPESKTPDRGAAHIRDSPKQLTTVIPDRNEQEEVELVLPEQPKRRKMRFWRRAPKTARGARVEQSGKDQIPRSRKSRLRPKRLLCGLHRKEQRDRDDCPETKTTVPQEREIDPLEVRPTIDTPPPVQEQELPSSNEPIEIFRFTFSNDRDNNGVLTEVPSCKKKKQADVNTSMETATTAGTEEEESFCQIEVEDLSILSAPRISTYAPSAKKSSQQPKPQKHSKKSPCVSTVSQPAPEPTNGEGDTKHNTTSKDNAEGDTKRNNTSKDNAEGDTKRNNTSNEMVVRTPEEKQTVEVESSFAIDSAQLFQDIAVAFKNTVASTLSGFVSNTMEQNHVSPSHVSMSALANGTGANPVSERTESKDDLDRPIGEMLDAIYIPTRRMRNLNRNNNDDDEKRNDDGDNGDTFSLLGSTMSMSIASSLPSVALDLDATILSWDLDTVLEKDRCQSQRDLDVVLEMGHSRSKRDLDIALERNLSQSKKNEKFKSDQQKCRSQAVSLVDNCADTSLSNHGDTAVLAKNFQNGNVSQVHDEERKELSEDIKSGNLNPSSSVLEDLPYRATKITVRKKPIKDSAMPDLESTKENRENAINYPRAGRTESHQQSPGVSRAKINEPKLTPPQKTTVLVSEEKNGDDNDIHSVESLPFHPIIPNTPRRKTEDNGRLQTMDISSSSRRSLLSEKGDKTIAKKRVYFADAKFSPKHPEQAQGNECFLSNESTNQAPTRTSVPTTTSNKSNYVVDENGFLVDTTTAVLEDLEKSFEGTRQDKRKQRSSPSPSPQLVGGINTDHMFAPPQPYWESIS